MKRRNGERNLRGVGESIGPTVYMVYSISLLVYNRLEVKETDLPSFRQQLVNRELVSQPALRKILKSRSKSKRGFEQQKQERIYVEFPTPRSWDLQLAIAPADNMTSFATWTSCVCPSGVLNPNARTLRCGTTFPHDTSYG